MTPSATSTIVSGDGTTTPIGVEAVECCDAVGDGPLID